MYAKLFYHIKYLSMLMATPLITGDAAAHQFLSEQFKRQHAYSLFSWRKQQTKAEAHAEAWRRLMEERERQRRIQAMIQQQRNQVIR